MLFVHLLTSNIGMNMDNTDKEVKPLEVMVTGGTEDERVHLAMAIGEHFVTNRQFTNAVFEFEGCQKEEDRAKLLRWGDVYAEMNKTLHMKPIAIRALPDKMQLMTNLLDEHK